MKKSLLSLLLMASATLFVYAQNPPKKVTLVGEPTATSSSFVPSVEGPKIEFEKTTYDYGQIQQGGNGDGEFKFKNVGSEPLVLTNVQASCGCTTPSWPREPIMPGQEGAIKVHYNTNNMGGFTKTVTVYSNSIDNQERVTLRLTGTVNPK